MAMFTDLSKVLMPTKTWQGLGVSGAWQKVYLVKDSGVILRELLLNNFSGSDQTVGLMICPAAHTDGGTIDEQYAYLKHHLIATEPSAILELVTGVSQGWEIRVFSTRNEVNIYLSGVFIQR